MMSKPLVIACVKWGELYGAYYVNTLFDMVRRHLPKDFDCRFECFTDDPAGLQPDITARALPGDLDGWWNKLHLFKEGMFAPDQRILYFDLDTIITGPLGGILQYRGDFAILRDFYRPDGYCSAVMLWRAGAGYPIWSGYEARGRPLPAGGDQTWIETAYPGAQRLQDCFPRVFASYKVDCHPLPPPGTSVVCFHGEPKQDNCDATWVRDIWKPEGISGLVPGKAYATVQEERLAHMHHAETVPYPWFEPVAAHARVAAIVGSGATLDECRTELLQGVRQEYDVFAVNKAAAWLAANNIPFTAQVISGDRVEHAAFVATADVPCYCASTCHPSVQAEAGGRLVLWSPDELGGATTGLKAIHLAHLLGYRSFHLYGFDSCYVNVTHNERERMQAVELHGRWFRVNAWMLKQADEFVKAADTLLPQGCSITLHGDGLLHFLATKVRV